MSIKASTKSISISPRKVEVVVSLLKKRTIEDALIILEHTPRRAALPLSKLLKSARANAENNHGYKPDSLVINSIYVTPGPRLKRSRPAAFGRALPYQKRSAHVFVELDGKKREPKPASRRTTNAKEKK